MKIVVSKRDFLDALTKAARFVDKKATRPVIQSVYLAAPADPQKYGFFLGATDLETRVRIDLPVIEHWDAACCLLDPGVVLHFLRTVECESIEIGLRDSTVTLEAVGGIWPARIEFGTADPMDFPEVLLQDEPRSTVRVGKALAHMIKNTVFCVEKDGSRFNLVGSIIQIRDATLSVAASDGRRLAWMEAPIEVEADSSSLDAIIHWKTALKIATLFENCEETRLRWDIPNKRDVVISGGGVEAIALPVDAAPPKWRDVVSMSKPPIATIAVQAKDLKQALELACSITISERWRFARTKFIASDNKLAMETDTDSEYRKACCEIAASTSGEAQVMMSTNMLLEFANHCEKDDTIEIEVYGGENPVFFRAGELNYVQMPIVDRKPFWGA